MSLPTGIDPSLAGAGGEGAGLGLGGGFTQVALPFNVDATLGALLIGGLAGCFLYGLTCLQTFIYFLRYGHDRRFLRLLVFVLWCIDTFDTILTSHVMYHYFVNNYVNPSAIFFPVWSLKLHVAVTSVCDFIVRSMFARRVFRLSGRNFYLTGFIVAVSIVDLVVGLIITVRAFGISTFPGLSAVSTLFYLNFASGLTGDLAVAFVLCYYLFTSKTGFNKTDSILRTLIAYTVTTGLLTAFDASAGLICYAIMPGNLVFIAFYLQLGKLYLNSYLASLNFRKRFLGSMKSDGMVSIHLSRVQPSFKDISSNPSSVGTQGALHRDRSTGHVHNTSGYAQVKEGERSPVVVDRKGGEREAGDVKDGGWSGRISRLGREGSKDGHDILDSPMEIKVETTVETETSTLDRYDMNEEPLPHFAYDRPHKARTSQGQTGFAV